MRDKLYLAGFLVGAGLLLYLGRDLLRSSIILAWGLAFGGTTAVAILGVLAYRFRLELEASRHELARTEAELSFARKVQRELFPRELPRTGGLELAAICIPARGISGDYYDVVALEDGRHILAVADISGKGISAAILMAHVHALLRVLASLDTNPSSVCARLSRHLHQVTDASRFATLFYADWTPRERRLRYVNAGHNPPLLMRADSASMLSEGGIPLGIVPEPSYEMGDLVLEPGNLLVLYSDGITEASQLDGAERVEFGEERLRRIVAEARHRRPAEIQKHVLEAVRAFSAKEPEDDMTLMVVKVLEG